jgi:hypothetical protein
MPAPTPQWRDYISTAGEFMGRPGIDNLDTILRTFEHGIPKLADGLIPYGDIYNFVAQLVQDANADTCLGNRIARAGIVVIEQAGVTYVSTRAGHAWGMFIGTGAGTATGGNLVAFGSGYIAGWSIGYFGSYCVMTIGVNHLNENVLFPLLEEWICEEK